MLVNLYAVRVVLGVLGADDFGIFNVVGGIVVLFTFLNFAMTSATQRFLNFALGRNDMEQAKDVYSVSLVIHLLIAVLVIVFAQTVGLWFFHTWLNIPPERQAAAFVVYQFSVATTVIGILQVPYRATIMAHEKMTFFATLSIVEAVLKLGIVFLLPVILFDHLKIYVFLIFVTRIVILLIHKIYCNTTFETARFRYCKDRQLFRQLMGFSGWSVFGGVASLSRDHGTNILLNIFHGVTVNAAMGVATQVNSAVFQFVGNFQMAFNPQITKLYSAKDYDSFMRLVFRAAKASFCLLFFFALPLSVNADFILRLWLNNVPEYSVVFVQLILLFSLLEAIVAPLGMSVQATGDIKKYQLIISCFIFANMPLSLLFLWMGFNPVWVLVIRVGIRVISFIWQVFFFLGEKIKLPVLGFLREVIIPVSVTALASVIMVVFLRNFFYSDWNKLIISSVVSTISIGLLTYWVVINKEERALLRNWINSKRNGKKID